MRWLCAWGIAVLVAWSAPAGASAWPSLASAPEGERVGAGDAAVVVGIEKYAFVPGVPGATENAADWVVWLTRTRGVPLERVTLLRDVEATREEILQAAKTAAERVGPRGTLWFVFIGHGAPAQDQKDGVLVGVDAQQSPIRLYARSVKQRELLDTLEDARGQAVVVIDACFSGRTGSGAAIAKGLQPLLPAKVEAPRKAIVLSAGKASEFAGPLPGVERPAFSYLVLGGLRGWADVDGDGKVSARDAVDYARTALRSTLKGRNQTPQLWGKGDAVVLAEGAREPGPDLLSIVLGERRPPKAAARAEPSQPTATEDASGARPQRLSSAAVKSTLHRIKAKARACLKLMPNPPAGSVRVKVKFVIIGSGAVRSASVVSGGGTTGAVQSCVVRAIKGLRFDAFDDPSMTVSYPVRLQ